MEDINKIVHEGLTKYAQLYFEAVVKANTYDGACTLKAGNYTAKDLTDNSHKSVFGHAYKLPVGEEWNKEITITAGNFECGFMYRDIFVILYKWERMMHAGKSAAVFKIGDVEQKTAKVLTTDKDVFGNFKYKRVNLRRVSGNWWTPATKRAKTYPLYYELNGIMFDPGVNCYSEGDLIKRAETLPEERVINALKQVLKRINEPTECEKAKIFTQYWAEVARLAGVKVDASEEERKIIPDEQQPTADIVNNEAPTNQESPHVDPPTEGTPTINANSAVLSDLEPSKEEFITHDNKHAQTARKRAILGYSKHLSPHSQAMADNGAPINRPKAPPGQIVSWRNHGAKAPPPNIG